MHCASGVQLRSESVIEIERIQKMKMNDDVEC